MIKNSFLCCGLSLMLVLLECVTAQFLPPIACSEYFQYLQYNNIVIGKVTIPNISPGVTKLDLEFSQPQTLETTYYGRISLFQSQDQTINSIHAGQPIAYRVDFPIPENPPKLTKIFVNDNLICSASSYPRPNTMIKLQHTLETTTQNVLIPSGGNFGPFGPVAYPTRPVVTRPPQIPQQTPPPTPPPTPRTPRPQPPPSPRPATAVSGECGQEGKQTPLIFGGSIIARGQFPWLIPIYRKVAADTKFICGGSLVSTRTIITAAHCFTLTSLRADQIVVYVGRYQLDSFSEQGYETRELRDLQINPDYDPNVYPDADIALLQMKSPVQYTQFIRPICLWVNPTPVEGRTGYVAGWGSDETGIQVSPVPKMAEANIVSEAECLRSDGFSGLTSSRTICAGNRDGTGPCKGDSGGGLMIQQNGRWLLRGIISAGQSQNRQCDLHQYVIYCDLAKHQTWIQSNILN